MASAAQRSRPSILITGTPGTGKSSLCQALEGTTGLKYVCVGKEIKKHKLYDEFDEEFDAIVLDEDKVLDHLEDVVAPGGCVVEFHSCDFFPERWFDLVVVLRTDNEVLYPRLEKRGYSAKKLSENMEAEIMQVVLDEARESYAKEVVLELQSNTMDDMDKNVEMLTQWVAEHSKE